MGGLISGLLLFAALGSGTGEDISVEEIFDEPESRLLSALTQRAEQGDMRAMFLLGGYYHFSEKEEIRDLSKAAYWYERAADKGHAESQDYLGQFYSGGIGGLPVDCEKSIEWYSRAAESGYSDSWGNLAWKLSTCEDKGLRDGQKALQILKVHAAHLKENAAVLDTMAAAHAAVGNFEMAKTLQIAAIALVEHRDQGERLDALRERLRLYSHGKTWEGASFEKPEHYR